MDSRYFLFPRAISRRAFRKIAVRHGYLTFLYRMENLCMENGKDMIYIRTDMNSIIATGHVMRCLAIADAAKSMGEFVTFILADDQAAELIKKHGHQMIIMHTPWNDMESELPVMERLAKEYKIDRILVDSYQVTKRYLECLSKLMRVFYMDDLNAFYYPVSNIICYANYWEKFQYCERYPKSKLFLGTEYVPLRAEFSECIRKKINLKVEKLLLLSGGTDHYQVLNRILEMLDINRYSQINVFCGKYNMQYREMKEKNRAYKNVHINKAVPDIKRYMSDADLAISAGGTTLYELCAVGTPAISYAVADNQLDNVKKFQEDGVIDYAGDVRRDDVIRYIRKYLKIYDMDQEMRQEKSRKMQKLVDGKGAWRIANALIQGNVRN